ncbi:MAG: O-antigen ligase family protein [Candidatus Kuenenbacteria bacterium]
MNIIFVGKLSLYVFFASIFIYLLSFLGFLRPETEVFGFFLLITTLIGLSFWKIEYGLLFLIFEFLAGIDGHLFEFKSISIRFALFAVFMFIWLIQKLWNFKTLKTQIKNFTKSFFFKSFAFALFFIALAGILGIIRGNSFNLILADLICYSYLLLIFPFFDLIFNNKQQVSPVKKHDSSMACVDESDLYNNHQPKSMVFLNRVKKIFQIFSGTIMATSALTITTLYLFSSHSAIHGGIYYQWFREYIIGKIATMNNNFFRVVMSSDILTLVFFLIITSILLFALENKIFKNKKYWINTQLPWLIFLGILTSSVLIISFTRNFLIGFIISFIFLCLILKIPLKRKIIFSVCLIIIFLLESSLIFYLCNHKSVQTNFLFLGNRIETIFTPETEASAISRLERLDASLKKFKEHPILGSGVGSEIVAYDYAIQKIIKTPHIDWGYLENWIELGLFGFLSYLWFLGILFWQGVKAVYYSTDNCDFYLGILIGLFCLFVIHIFGPFLFYPTSIFYILLCLMLFTNAINVKCTLLNSCSDDYRNLAKRDKANLTGQETQNAKD